MKTNIQGRKSAHKGRAQARQPVSHAHRAAVLRPNPAALQPPYIAHARKPSYVRSILAATVMLCGGVALADYAWPVTQTSDAPRETCTFSMSALGKTPAKTSPISQSLMIKSYIEGERLFREAMAKRGIDVPPYIDASLASLFGDMESKNGTDMHTKGSSYFGPFQFRVTGSAEYSHYVEYSDDIRATMNVVKDRIPLFHGCAGVTDQMLTDIRTVEDPTAATIALLTIALNMDDQLRHNNSYRALSNSQKISAIYIRYNHPTISKTLMSHIDSKKTIDKLLPVAVRARTIKDMDGNQKVYWNLPPTAPAIPGKSSGGEKNAKMAAKIKTSRRKNTVAVDKHYFSPRQLLKNVIAQTKEGARLLEQYRNYRPNFADQSASISTKAKSQTIYWDRRKTKRPERPA